MGAGRREVYGKAFPDGARDRMVRAERPGAVSEGLLVPADRFLALTCHLEGAGKVVAGDEGVGVEGA